MADVPEFPALGPLGDVPPDAMRAYLHWMADWVANYGETIEQRPIVPAVEPGEVTSHLSATIPEHAEPISDILSDLDSVVMPGVVHWGHPAFLGYFGSTSNGAALLGEIAAAALNVSAMTWKTSPSATELETVVLSWIRQMIGLPDAFTGVVYDTASVGIVHALAAAREATGADIRSRGLTGRTDLPVFRIYASDQAHSSIERAAIMLGLGESNVVRVSSDADFRMDTAALERAIAADVAAGFRPVAAVATVGTTSTASIDSVREIARICRAHDMWLHVDAAYGGALAVLPERRDVLDGVELADSVIVNPHKWLFVPLDFSTLYVRDPALLKSVFALVPEYLRGDSSADRADGEKSGAIDYMDFGIQLGRRFRALKAWMVFRAFGRDGIEARIREHCRLAQLLAGWVEESNDFVLAAPVTAGVVCFRYERAGLTQDASDDINEIVAERVNAAGDAYVTHTRLHGRTALRVGIGNVRTTERTLAHVWERIQRESRQAWGA